MARNLVVCLDGTNNEPVKGHTNVGRTYEVSAKSDSQRVYYDPGVGTMGSSGTVTTFGKWSTRTAGLVVGFGIADKVQNAYTWLANRYRRGDRIFVFGFSRGAFGAVSLAGLLRTTGLIREDVVNLTPYAWKSYIEGSNLHRTSAQEKDYWRRRRTFNDVYGNPDFPNPFNPHVSQVHFLGVWDTVHAVRTASPLKGFSPVFWPFTRKISNVNIARHALALDERRRPYSPYRFAPDRVQESDGRVVEQWFAGVHSDVGGAFDDHRLADIPFAWMIEEAMAAGLEVDPKAFQRRAGFPLGETPVEELAHGAVHPNPWVWSLLAGWRPRQVLPGDLIHPSVHAKMAATSYRPRANDFPTGT